MDILAIQGGKPVRDTYLSYSHQWIDDDDIETIINVLKGEYLTSGPKIEQFEKKFANYVGAEYAVAISSGTSALHAACYAAGIGKGDEVITTPITFAASANCILYCDGIPVFADVDFESYNISPKEIEKRITSKTKAIIPVHFTGQPCDIDEIHKIAKNYNLIVIEDAAHALGAKYKGKILGSLSDMTIFSFHPVKHITTGEGGMITTNDYKLYKKLVLFRNHCITREKKLLYNTEEGDWYYEQLDLGYNYRITDIQCALGISQLDKLDKFIARRREIAEMYNKALSNIDGVIIPYQKKWANSSWHLYVIQIELEKFKVGRKEIFQALRAENIGVNVHYIPVYYHPYYQNLGYKKGLCPNAEKLYERFITIPLYPKMTDRDVFDVVNALKKVLDYYRK